MRRHGDVAKEACLLVGDSHYRHRVLGGSAAERERDERLGTASGVHETNS